MKLGRLYLANDQTLLLDKVMLTTNPLERMRGLLARPPLQENEGLLIRPCSSVHTIGMAYPIDLVFIDSHWHVLKLVHNLVSFRMAWCKNAHMVLETAAQTIARWKLEPQHELRWEDS